MRISKISSKATYHKCLKALHAQGYIKYEPSYNPFKGSHVFLFNFSENLKPFSKTEKSASPIFEPVSKQVAGNSNTATESSPKQVDEQVVVPYINNTNNTNDSKILNSLNLDEPEKKIEEEFIFRNENLKEEKSSAKKEEKVHPPEIGEVLNYFGQQQFPETEANKFFNYFKSIGWLVGGKTPMADWQAAANNWMLNASKFITNERTDRTKQLHTSAGKDYSEPL